MKSYKALTKQIYSFQEYKLVPLRFQDRIDIMNWRNDQMYHLRQATLLTIEDQNNYFNTTIASLYNQEKPKQLLFSFLKKDRCIAYGGLVHINWIDKNAEVSFVIDTELENDYFESYWIKFLNLITEVAEEIRFHKIFTYAFDLRPKLYPALQKAHFIEEARLKQHCFYQDKFLDVVIHSKILGNVLSYRQATLNDASLLFGWINEQSVRENSLSSDIIEWEDHLKWFKKKLEDGISHIFIFSIDHKPVGQVRLDLEGDHWVIDYSIDKMYRRKGIGTEMLGRILKIESFHNFLGIVKEENVSSRKVFRKLGFEEFSIQNESGIKLSKFIYNSP